MQSAFLARNIHMAEWWQRRRAAPLTHRCLTYLMECVTIVPCHGLHRHFVPDPGRARTVTGSASVPNRWTTIPSQILAATTRAASGFTVHSGARENAPNGKHSDWSLQWGRLSRASHVTKNSLRRCSLCSPSMKRRASSTLA